MRITVGGLLVTAAVGGAIVYGVGHTDVSKDLRKLYSSTKNQVESLMNIAKTDTTPAPESVKPIESPVIEGPPPPLETPPTVKTVETPVQLIKKPAPKKKVVRKKKNSGKKVVKKRAAASKKKAAPADPLEKMLGAFVSLDLTSGRTIKGVLEGYTKQDYKIALPGLGVFSYPRDNVKKIALAK